MNGWHFFGGLFIVATLTLKPIWAFSWSYASYCNNRFGFCVEYPDFLVNDRSSANNDGRQFRDDQDFLMIASGINNILEDTVRSEMTSQSKRFDKITYQARGKNWFVLSGYKGSTILYLKTYVGRASINHLYLQYPLCNGSSYNDIVKVISRSFTPGDLENAH